MEINLEKLITSLLNTKVNIPEVNIAKRMVENALEEQGLKYYNGSILRRNDKPKFKIGDWISGYYTNYKVLSVNNDGYLVEDVDGNKINILFENEKFHHLFTIKDAKDGDVLAYENHIVIFKENNYNPKDKSGCMFVYCSCNNFHEIGGINPTDYKPATKEQRDLLFAKMKEAGYEWDAGKKELKKIENEIEIPFGANDSELQEATYYIPKGFHAEIEGNNVIIKKGEQNPTWSEEDEAGLSDAMWAIEQARTIAKDENDMGNLWYAERWLKSLKERVQPKQEWSEEDLSLCARIQGILNVCKSHSLLSPDLYKEMCDWLKSLKERYTWKPSDEQIIWLYRAADDASKDSRMKQVLNNLLLDLKKLREDKL